MLQYNRKLKRLNLSHNKFNEAGGECLARSMGNQLLSNLCRATSGAYINFGCSKEVLFLRGYFQWSMSLRGGRYFCRSREVAAR